MGLRAKPGRAEASTWLGNIGVWRSLVAHPVWGRKVAGSNPVTPTRRWNPLGKRPQVVGTSPATASEAGWSRPVRIRRTRQGSGDENERRRRRGSGFDSRHCRHSASVEQLAGSPGCNPGPFGACRFKSCPAHAQSHSLVVQRQNMRLLPARSWFDSRRGSARYAPLAEMALAPDSYSGDGGSSPSRRTRSRQRFRCLSTRPVAGSQQGVAQFGQSARLGREKPLVQIQPS